MRWVGLLAVIMMFLQSCYWYNMEPCPLQEESFAGRKTLPVDVNDFAGNVRRVFNQLLFILIYLFTLLLTCMHSKQMISKDRTHLPHDDVTQQSFQGVKYCSYNETLIIACIVSSTWKQLIFYGRESNNSCCRTHCKALELLLALLQFMCYCQFPSNY